MYFLYKGKLFGVIYRVQSLDASCQKKDQFRCWKMVGTVDNRDRSKFKLQRTDKSICDNEVLNISDASCYICGTS